MAGICSKHMGSEPVEGCALCHTTPEDIFGKESWQAAVKRAEEAGLHECVCGFRYYRTTDSCPKCEEPLQEDL